MCFFFRNITYSPLNVLENFSLPFETIKFLLHNVNIHVSYGFPYLSFLIWYCSIKKISLFVSLKIENFLFSLHLAIFIYTFICVLSTNFFCQWRNELFWLFVFSLSVKHNFLRNRIIWILKPKKENFQSVEEREI